jgi:DtxR family Mn-dependent transcriptional regulator
MTTKHHEATRTQRERVAVEDALKHVHDCEWRQQPATAHSLAGALGLDPDAATRLLARLEASGLVGLKSGRYELTHEGRNYARQVIRAHRLYETYLAQQTGLAAESWHTEAERVEHSLTRERVERLAHELGHPRFDPHGDPIPTAGGDVAALRGTPLLECPVGWEGRIIHIEDEPRRGYAEVVAAGLAAGMLFRVVEADEQSVRLNAEGRTIQLSGLAAGHILTAREHFDETITRLSTLKPGERAAVVGLSSAVRGAERNRLLDLGVAPGTVVEIDLVSPAGNPIAYLIRGTSIALRREQSERILVRKL